MSGIISSPFLLEVLSFAMALTFSVLVQPILIRFSRSYRYEAIPNSRSSHNIPVPTLGGIGIALSMAWSCILVVGLHGLASVAPALLAMLALLFFGIIDDLKKLTATRKLLAQLLVVIPFVLITGIHIESLYGLLGFYELSETAAVVISIFFYIFMINAYNLIDGIDGLAAGLGAIGSSIFGMFFSVQGDYLHAILAFSLTGALLGFLRFNFSPSKKIFMGDTGSMLLGFILAVFAVTFLGMEGVISLYPDLYISNSPIVVIGILMVPIFDTLRVFLVRLMDGRNPFSPDQNHIHHILLRLKLSHFHSSVVLYIVSIFFACFGIVFSSISFVFYLAAFALPLIASTFFFRDPNKPGGLLRLLVRLRVFSRKIMKPTLFFSRKNTHYFSGQYDPV